MKTKHWLFSFVILFFSVQLAAQMQEKKPRIFIYVADNRFPMKATISQTEEKKGWSIQGYNIGRHNVRYFWGEKAKQQTNNKPQFAIYLEKENLNDYVLIRLKEKRSYRQMPYVTFADCNYTRVELNNFSIKNLPEMGFAVTPLKPLFPGEYILVNIAQESINSHGDFIAYDFSVPEN